MFESEDFDLDEDFLKDIGEKEEHYYSQINNDSVSSQVEPPPKRLKTENLDSDFSDIIFDDEPDFARNTVKSVEISSGKSKLPDTRIITPLSQTSQNIEETRKNLALAIFRKSANPEPNKSLFQETSPLRQIPPSDRRNFNISDNLQENRQKRSSDIFKKPTARSKKSPARYTSKDSPNYSSAPRMTLERKFPGPAGLLPDTYDANLDHSKFLNIHDESKLIDKNLDDPEYCSQNTEKLFRVGAWRTMLNDLPPNFLKGHQIAEIKRRGRHNYAENMRVPFLAGVIQRIDCSAENPNLVLKDLSDSIEATMHREIPSAHPNILDAGVVILLRDIALLSFEDAKHGRGLHLHAMIAPQNLLAAYNEKTRLVTSPLMETILGESFKTLDKPQISSENLVNDTCAKNPIFADNMEISDFEIDDDEIAFACIDSGDVKDSQVASSFSKDSKPERSRGRKNDSNSFGGSSKTVKTAESVDKIEESGKTIETDDKSTEDTRSEQENTSTFGTFGDDLLNSDNDTEDEILSQLDMDSIVTSYNSGI